MYVRLLVIYTLLALCCAVMAQEDGLVAAIPRLTGITIDGDSADWGDRGFRIDQLLPWGGPSVRARLTTVADHDAQVRLGWDDAGLLVLVTVRDDVWVEEAEVSQLGRYDALEVYLSPERGSPEILQWVIGPGMTPEQPALRWHLYDYRTAEELLAIPAAPEAARRTIAGGLRVELRLPWAALGITPAVGREAAFQFWSHDVDDPKETVTHVLPWYPTLGAFRNSKLMHRIRLSDAAGPAIVARAVGDCDMAALLPRVTVLAPATQGGMPVQVRQGKHVLVQGALAVDEAGRASATLLLPRAARQPFAHLQVVVGETVVDTVSYPYAHRLAAIARLREQQEAVRAHFRLDHPEETLADAPAAVRRHRGLAALALRWLEPGFWATEEQQLRALGEVADIVDVLKGRDILGGRRGAFWEGYYSLADGSGQPFVTVLPEGYTPRKTYPLIIYLHGMGVRLMPHYEAPLQEPYIIVRAWGRGDTFYNGLGEDDILQVLAHMRRWYRIDPDRVYLLGESMGGTGIWHIAARHPDLFAAVAPYFGVPSNVPLANLRNLPVLNQHGAQDWTVAVDYSRYGVSHLQQWGYPVLYREFPEAGHALPYAPAYAWLPTFRRVRRPEAVTLTTEVPGGLYWLRVEEMADPHRQCDVTARVVGAGRQQAVMLEAPNAAAIALDAAAMPLDRKAPLQIQVDGQALTQPAPLPERLYLRQHDGAWTLATHRAPTPSPVRPYRAGAGADLFAGEPLMIVYGTRGGAARAALLQEAAERMRLLAGERMMIVGGWPVKADRDVAEADLARCNLILIGGAADNALVARMAGHLPFRLTPEGLVAGTHAPVSLHNAAYSLVYLNPLAPSRLLVLLAADVEGEALDNWLRYLPWRVPGAHGHNRLAEPDLQVAEINGPIRLALQFTHGWQWRRVPGGEAPLADHLTGGQYTRAVTQLMRQATGAEVALSWGSHDTQVMYDAATVTRGEVLATTSASRTLLCRMTGAELADLHATLGAKGWISADPPLDPTALTPARSYRVVMPPPLCQMLAQQRRRNLTDVTAGPVISAEAVARALLEQHAP